MREGQYALECQQLGKQNVCSHLYFLFLFSLLFLDSFPDLDLISNSVRFDLFIIRYDMKCDALLSTSSRDCLESYAI